MMKTKTLAGTVLAVDDDPMLLELLTRQLERSGYAVDAVLDGPKALKLLGAQPDRYDVILLDRMMPDMGGMEVLAALKADPVLCGIPVIMQTAAGEKSQLVEGLKAGVYYYLVKPFDREVLVPIVRTAIAEHRRQRALRAELAASEDFLQLMRNSRFLFRTLEDAQCLLPLISRAFPQPDRVMLGIMELFINAIEHGNLGITYAEKSELHTKGLWVEEVNRRLTLPENQQKFAEVSLARQAGRIELQVKDCGNGFDWQRFMDIDPDRALHLHGRGIAMARLVSFDRLEYQEPGNCAVASINLPA